MAHKPTFFDLTLKQLVVPFVTVTVYVPGLFTVTVSVLPPETIPPDGPLHENAGLAPPPADTTATNCSCVPPPGALHATSAIVITGFWSNVRTTESDAPVHPVPVAGFVIVWVNVAVPNP